MATESFLAAASASVAAVLAGPPRRVTVAAVTPDAVYLSTGDPDAPAVCLESPAAVRLPCAVVLGGDPQAARAALAKLRVGAVGTAGTGRLPLASPSASSRAAPRYAAPGPSRSGSPGLGSPVLGFPGLGHVAPGSQVLALPGLGSNGSGSPIAGSPGLGSPGAGGLALDAVTVRVVRWWQPPQPALGGAGLRPRAGELPDVAALLGCGAGLTPYGDDVLTGALVALAAVGSPAAGTLAAAILPTAFTRTTFVSAALLVHAARGECIPALADYLHALPAGDPARLARAAAALHAVGHSSGAGLLEGVARILDTPALGPPQGSPPGPSSGPPPGSRQAPAPRPAQGLPLGPTQALPPKPRPVQARPGQVGGMTSRAAARQGQVGGMTSRVTA